ncbi:MAG: riboflavin synthase [Deltaproteobacteria bacterium]|nr:riboflavin synthase [Deltaproteobacteria bacterium]
MFTGLALGRGQIVARSRLSGGESLTVRPLFAWDDPLALGESVAVSGVCLTVEKIETSSFTAFASQETLARSTLGSIDQVNLERALRLADRLGGHLVSGHVDGRGRVRQTQPNGLGRELTLSLPKGLSAQVVPKGSIAVDGISLTVNEVGPDYFTVQIIPATLERTTLIDLAPGREVNLETDLLAKYVQKLLSSSPAAAQGLTLEKLAESGFL